MPTDLEGFLASYSFLSSHFISLLLGDRLRGDAQGAVLALGVLSAATSERFLFLRSFSCLGIATWRLLLSS